jgi:outer membrane murein-binding lipoprotein Lpp
VFDQLQAAGINTFEDLKNASGNQIFAIVSGLDELNTTFDDVFVAGSQRAADESEANFGRISNSVDGLTSRFERLENSATNALNTINRATDAANSAPTNVDGIQLNQATP